MNERFGDFVQKAKLMAHEHRLIEVGNEEKVMIVKIDPVTAELVFKLIVSPNFSWQLEFKQDIVSHATGVLQMLRENNWLW